MSFWIPFIIISAAFIVIIFIITKKFPTLASIDTEAIPWDREQRLKKALLANRLSRKLAERGRSVLLIVLPIWNIIKRSAVSLFRKIRELETHYRLSRKAGHLPDSPNPAEEDILIKARKYIEDGEFHKAEDALIAVIKHNPRQIAAYEGLIDVYMALHDYEHAQETLNYLLKIKKNVASDTEKPNISAASSLSDKQELAAHHFELAEVYKKSGERDKALRSYKEAARLDSRNPKYLDSLLEMSILLENKLLAEKTLSKLKAVNPDNAKLKDWGNRIVSM